MESNIHSIIEKANDWSADPEFDFISLGCGNGIKDSIIIKQMISYLDPNDMRQFIYYYPVDISPYMLMEATHCICEDMSEEYKKNLRCRLRVKCIWGDMRYSKTFKPIYEYYNGNKFFAVLGNTIGNEGERKILAAIQRSLTVGDLLLIEYNADIDSKRHAEHFVQDENINRHWNALMQLDSTAKCDKKKFRELAKGEKSDFAECSVMTVAENVRFDRKRGHPPIPELGLAVLHSYDKTRFEEEFERRGFETLDNFVDDEHGVGLYFGRRQK